MPDCEICILGKHTANPFSMTADKWKTDLLELIHSDICDPMREKSIGGGVYFVTFIDNKSRYTQIYVLKSKDEVKEAFMKYKALVENQKGRKIKILRTDKGLEYLGKDFTEELEKTE